MTPSMVIIVSVVAFSVAIILSMFGKGGGEFYVPILMSFGIGIQSAGTTSLLCLVLSGSAMTFIYHSKMKQVDWLLALVLFSTAGIASFFGGFFSGYIPPFYLKITFALTILVAAAVMYLRKKVIIKDAVEDMEHKRRIQGRFVWHRKSPEGDFDMNLLYVLPPIGIVGFLAGMVGISGGGLIVPIIIIFGSVPLRTAFATNSVLVLLTSSMGLLGRGLSMGIDLTIALPVGSAVFLGALIGASQSKKIDVKSLERLFIVILIIAALWMLYRAFY
jgi:uncharacterized membrane protein YfcA